MEEDQLFYTYRQDRGSKDSGVAMSGSWRGGHMGSRGGLAGTFGPLPLSALVLPSSPAAPLTGNYSDSLNPYLKPSAPHYTR